MSDPIGWSSIVVLSNGAWKGEGEKDSEEMESHGIGQVRC